MSRRGWFSRSAWSLSLASGLALGFGAPGCIGKRRPASERQQPAEVTGRLVQPSEVDGSLDALVDGDRVLAVYDAQDPARGSAAPLVTIVEYSDFQCPFCGTLASALDDLMRDYGGEVKLVFKQFPLPIHPQAKPAARAALAAHAQGKFWEMHDRLFANRTALSDGQLERHARELGLDVDRWRKDFAGTELGDHVDAEQAGGSTLGVRGTPTFFINGKRYSGAMSVDQLRGIVDGEILAAQQLLAAGAKREELYARFLHPASAAKGTPPADAKPAQPAPPNPSEAPSKAEAPADDAPAPEAAPSGDEGPLAIPTGTKRPQRGPDDALVTLVQFGTFACETCKEVDATLDALLKRHPDDVRLVFRSMARSGADRRAAHIALAAHRQGKFWEAHDALLEHEGDFTAESASAFATELGLDVKAFEEDLRARGDDGANTLVRDDLALLDALDRRDPPPVLYVNGRRVEGTPRLATLEALVEEEKAKAKAFLAANPGVDAAGLYDAMRRTWGAYDKLESVGKTAAVPEAR